jgi:hypothetical protein
MMNWKERGRKQMWPNLRFYPGISVDGLRKTTENLSQYSCLQDEILNHDVPNMEKDTQK